MEGERDLRGGGGEWGEGKVGVEGTRWRGWVNCIKDSLVLTLFCVWVFAWLCVSVFTCECMYTPLYLCFFTCTC